MTTRADAHRPEFHREHAWKHPVRAATTGNIVIATGLNAGDVIDGVTLALGDRVLVKDQDTGSENGIWDVGPTPTRSYDLDSGIEAWGCLVRVLGGTVNAFKVFGNTNTTLPTIGIDALTFDSVTSSSGGAVVSVGRWRWTLSTSTPGTGRFGVSVQPPVAGAAAVLQIHESDQDSNDRSAYFNRMQTGDQLVVDDGRGNVWFHKITGAMTDNGTWRSIPILYDPRATTTLQPAEIICDVLLQRGVIAGLTVQDEGGPLATDATTLNFVGAGVIASGSGAAKTITIPGGSTGGDTAAWKPVMANNPNVVTADGAAVWEVLVTAEGEAIMAYLPL